MNNTFVNRSRCDEQVEAERAGVPQGSACRSQVRPAEARFDLPKPGSTCRSQVRPAEVRFGLPDTGCSVVVRLLASTVVPRLARKLNRSLFPSPTCRVNEGESPLADAAGYDRLLRIGQTPSNHHARDRWKLLVFNERLMRHGIHNGKRLLQNARDQFLRDS
jgi:hypothetical protein